MRVALIVLFLLVSYPSGKFSLSIPIQTFIGDAHICPISSTGAFTARHVAYITKDSLEYIGMPIVWSDGIATPRTFSYVRDIAYVESDKPFPISYIIAAKEPQIEDKVTITGYDGKGFQRVIRTKIINVKPIDFIMDDNGGYGSSGSCVFNSDGEVIGINYKAKVENGALTYGYAVRLRPEVVEGLTKKE